ncbi:MAG TPA: nuclear transport factor 2 family protein [Gaiellales bacterium]
MSEEHPDAIAYRRTAEAFRSGDLDVVTSLIAPEVVWHVPGDHPMAGTIEGREVLLEWLRSLDGIGFWLVEHDVFASDEHVCAVSTMGARRGDFDAQTRVISIFRFRDGRQVERWLYPDDAAAWNTIFHGMTRDRRGGA